jgi:acetate kinase
MNENRHILVINSGSSSIKYQLFDMPHTRPLAAGLLERIGTENSHHSCRWQQDDGHYAQCDQVNPIPDHRYGLHLVFKQLEQTGVLTHQDRLEGIGHRVVHGGSHFKGPTLIDEQVVEVIRSTIPLAPLHNPANLNGIEVAMDLSPDVPQVAIFDTAFHQTMPSHAYLYALPWEWYERYQVRRYGFHGTSHGYVAKRAAAMLNKPLTSLNLISMHLGNGASITAIKGGTSIDTSMGMTPLEGLVMGTRCGDIDPSIPGYMARNTNLDFHEIENELNQHSGLKGLCEVSDMREVIELAEKGNPRASHAIELFCYRIKKYIGAYSAVLGSVDGLIITGGIGEHSAQIRQEICSNLEGLGISLDDSSNQQVMDKETAIHTADSDVAILVIPTNEELEIAQQTEALLRDQLENYTT